MRTWLESLLKLNRYRDPLMRQRAGAVHVVLYAALLAVALGTFLDPEFDLSVPWAIAGTVITALLIGLAVLLWQGRLTLVRFALQVLAMLAGLGYYFITGGVTITGVLISVLLLIVTAVLTTEQGVLIVTALVLVKEAAAYLLLENGVNIGTTLAIGAFQLMFGVLLFMLARGMRQSTRLYELEATAQRSRLTTLSSEVLQNIFNRLDLETLFSETVEVIRSNFDGIYHAQIFLIDNETNDALLKASTGAVGAELLARGHKLPVGSQSVIGQVTLLGEPVLAQSGEDSVHRRNELLPNTRTELALPLISGERVIGALDVQSENANAFTNDDINILQTLANQIAIAIDNATLFAEQQAAIQENMQLAQQARAQVEQIQDLNRRLTRQAWSQYLEEQELPPALTVDFATNTMTPNAEWTPGMQEVVKSPTGPLAQPQANAMSVPLTVRGQAIGAMEFELEDGAPLTSTQVDLVQEVISRLALSLESNRLYEQAQRLARREAIINNLGARLQSTTGMENMLMTAAQGLQNALQAPHVAIRLGTPPTDTPAGIPAGAPPHADEQARPAEGEELA